MFVWLKSFVCLFLFSSGTIKSSSERMGLVWKLCFELSELSSGKLALLINDGDNLLTGRVKNPGDSSWPVSDGCVRLDRNASRSDVRLSLDCTLYVLTDDGISVVDAGIYVCSMRGSSVGSMILLFLRCGISILVGFSFFVLFKIVINFNGIALLLVKLFGGAFVVVTGIMIGGVVAILVISSVYVGNVVDGIAAVVLF